MLNYNKIELERNSKKIPKMEFYKVIGMTDSGYKKMIESNSMKVTTLEKIADVLEKPILYFFDQDSNEEYKSKYFETLEKYSKLQEEYNKLLKKEN